jgi:hypothetical protein
METPIIIKEEHPFTRAKMPKVAEHIIECRCLAAIIETTTTTPFASCQPAFASYVLSASKATTKTTLSMVQLQIVTSVKPLELCLSEAYTALAQEANRIVTKDYSFSDFNQIKTEVYRVVEQYFEGIQQQIKQFSSQS